MARLRSVVSLRYKSTAILAALAWVPKLLGRFSCVGAISDERRLWSIARNFPASVGSRVFKSIRSAAKTNDWILRTPPSVLPQQPVSVLFSGPMIDEMAL